MGSWIADVVALEVSSLFLLLTLPTIYPFQGSWNFCLFVISLFLVLISYVFVCEVPWASQHWISDWFQNLFFVFSFGAIFLKKFSQSLLTNHFPSILSKISLKLFGPSLDRKRCDTLWGAHLLTYLLSGASNPSCGRLSRTPPTIPVSLCVLFGEIPSLLPVGSNPPAEPLHLSQPRAKRSSSTTFPTLRVVIGKNPVDGVSRRKPSNVLD